MRSKSIIDAVKEVNERLEHPISITQFMLVDLIRDHASSYNDFYISIYVIVEARALNETEKEISEIVSDLNYLLKHNYISYSEDQQRVKIDADLEQYVLEAYGYIQ